VGGGILGNTPDNGSLKEVRDSLKMIGTDLLEVFKRMADYSNPDREAISGSGDTSQRCGWSSKMRLDHRKVRVPPYFEQRMKRKGGMRNRKRTRPSERRDSCPGWRSWGQTNAYTPQISQMLYALQTSIDVRP